MMSVISVIVFWARLASILVSSSTIAPNLGKCIPQNGFGTIFHADLKTNVLYEVAFIHIDCQGPIKFITHYRDYAVDENPGLVMQQQAEKIPLQDANKHQVVNNSPDFEATIYLNRHDCQNKIAPLKKTFYNSGSIFSHVGGLYHLIISEYCSEHGNPQDSICCLWQIDIAVLFFF
jgi:hypothetical protein